MATLDELGKKVKAKYPGQYKGLSDLEVGRRVRAKYPDAYTDFGGADTSRVKVTAHERGRPQRKPQPGETTPLSGYQRATNAIPYVTGGIGSVAGAGPGAVIGGLMGGPGGAVAGRRVGSAIGADFAGQGGEAIRQLLTEVPALMSGGVPAYEAAGGPANPGEAYQRIADVGADQAKLDAFGQILGGTAKYLGKGAMAVAARVNPEIAQTLIDNGIQISNLGKRKLMTLIGRLGAKTRGMVAGAGVTGRTLRADAVANEIEKRTLADLAKSSTGTNEVNKRALATLKADFLGHEAVASTGKIPLEAAHTFAQSANREIKPMYVRMADGQIAELPTDPVRRIWKTNENAVLNESLGHPAAVGPEYSATNAQTSKLIAAKNAIWPEVAGQQGNAAEVVRRGIPVATTLGGAAAGEEVGRRYHTPGGVISGAALGALLGSPMGMSTLALILSHPVLYAALRGGPQVAGGMMSAHE
jgi:hypothetical protein